MCNKSSVGNGSLVPEKNIPGCQNSMDEFLDRFFVFLIDFKIGLKRSHFDGSLKYLLYNSSNLYVHLLHHDSLPKIFRNSVNTGGL